MIYVAPACAAIAQWFGTETALRTELGREPEENEVRSRLGWPLVVGRVDVPYYPGGAGASVVFPAVVRCRPETKLRVGLTAMEGGGTRVTLYEVPES